MSSNAIKSIVVPLTALPSVNGPSHTAFYRKRINVPIIGLYADRPLEGSPTEEIIIRTFHENCRRSGISSDVRKVADLSIVKILSATVDFEDGCFYSPDRNRPIPSALLIRPNPHFVADRHLMVIPPKFLEIESMG
jgi:hypothetical protein